MSNRFNNVTTILATVDTAVVAATLLTFPPIIAIDQAIAGSVHMQAKLTTAAASLSYNVYALYSEDGINFDDSTIVPGNMNQIGTVSLNNSTSYANYSFPLSGLSISAKYMRIAIYPSASAGGTIAANSLKVVVRSPK